MNTSMPLPSLDPPRVELRRCCSPRVSCSVGRWPIRRAVRPGQPQPGDARLADWGRGPHVRDPTAPAGSSARGSDSWPGQQGTRRPVASIAGWPTGDEEPLRLALLVYGPLHRMQKVRISLHLIEGHLLAAPQERLGIAAAASTMSRSSRGRKRRPPGISSWARVLFPV